MDSAPKPPGGPDTPPPADQRRPNPPAFNVPPVTLTTTGVLIAVFGILTLAPVPLTIAVIDLLALRPIFVADALRDPQLVGSIMAALSLVSYALVHVDGGHIALNVGFLLAFGSACERALGSRRLIVILVVSAIAGAAAKLALDWNQPIVMYGASGAVFGCIGAVIRLMIAGPQSLRRRGVFLLLSLAVVSAVVTLIGPMLFGVGGRIAWDAHLGGFLAGVLLGRPPRRGGARATD